MSKNLFLVPFFHYMSMIPEIASNIDKDRLANPDAFYWPGYMWIWNDQLTREGLLSQLRDMKARQALTPMVVPEPKAFRPKNMPTRLDPEYLSDAFLDLYREMVDAAASTGMNIWLYDEGGWPSGSVCGDLVRRFPGLARQRLMKRDIITWKGREIRVPTRCVAVNLYKRGNKRHACEFVRHLSPGETCKIPFRRARVVAFTINRHGRYPDLLNPRSTAEFLRMTHERYKSVLQDHFGKTVTMMFTDEPNIPAKPPWTDDAAAGFLERKGYDLLPRLLSLFEGESASDVQTRVDYADWWSDRFAKAYFGQIQQWCHENGLLSGGHLNGEDESLGCLHHGFGHVLRPLRRMDVPGVDVIWRQLWPGKLNHHFPKYASSVAHQKGSSWALSESFAVYGAGLTPAQMKWIVDYQAVRGITLFDLAVYQQSNLDWFTGGERPVFGDSNPLWHVMDQVHGYIARLGYLLSCGQPEITIAVYYPVRDFWANETDVHLQAAAHDRVVQRLLDLQCDFDFIDDDLLVDPATSVDAGALHVGPMRYRIICLSPTKWISPAARTALSKYARSGVKVLWVTNASNIDEEVVIPEGMTVASLDHVRDHLPGLVEIQPDTPGLHERLRACKRRLSDGAVYFITNEHAESIEATVVFHEDGIPLHVDPGSGKIGSVPGAVKRGKGWEIPLKFYFAGSRVIWFNTGPTVEVEPSPDEDEDTRHSCSRKGLVIDEGWNGQVVRSYEIQKAGFEVYDFSSQETSGHVTPPGILANPVHVMQPRSNPIPIALGDWRSWAGEGFSGEIEYSVEFPCTQSVAEAARSLDLGDVRYVARVELNGCDLGTRTWAPYSFPIGNKLQMGRNVLRVRVTNTLANQYHSFSPDAHWSKARLGPYHPRALKFEVDSLPSGLYGPVAIMTS